MARGDAALNGKQRLSWKYFCQICLRSTHETGAGESELHICYHCFTNTDWEKYLAEGGDPCRVPDKYRSIKVRRSKK